MSVVLHAAIDSLLGALGKASLAKNDLPCTEAVVTAYDVILHLWREATEICAEVENGDVVLDVFTMEGDGIVRICGRTGQIIWTSGDVGGDMIDLPAEAVREIAMDKGLPDDEEFMEQIDTSHGRTEVDIEMLKCGICGGGMLTPEDVVYHAVAEVADHEYDGKPIPCMKALVNMFRAAQCWSGADDCRIWVDDGGALRASFTTETRDLWLFRFDPETGEESLETMYKPTDGLDGEL